MRRLWLHIGSHKTGSTSLQRSLRRTSKKQGLGPYHYLHVPNRVDLNPFVKNEGAGAGMVFWLDWPLLEKLIPQSGDCIISTEMLFWLDDPAVIHELAQFLRKTFDDIQVVAYLRRQDRLALSHRKQVVMGHAASRFYGAQLQALPDYQPHMLRYFDYASKIEKWAQAFGASNLIVRRYQKADLVGGDTVLDFFSLIDQTPEQIQKQANAAWSRRELLVGLWLRQRDYPRDAFLPVVADLREPEKLMPSKAQAQAFFAHFAEHNARLAQMYDPEGPKGFFDDDFSSYPDTPNDRMEDLDVDLAAIEAKVQANLAGGR